MERCDVLKISDNEVEFLFDTTDYDKGAALIEEKYHIPLVLITMGKDGSRAYYRGRKVEAAPFLQEKTIETTGAGDTFCASTLNYVLEHGLRISLTKISQSCLLLQMQQLLSSQQRREHSA